MHNPVGWFGIHAQDMARAKTFYENVFGLPLQEIAGGRFYLFGTDWQHYGVSGMIWQDEGANPAAYGGSTLFFTCEDCCRKNSRLQTVLPPLSKTAKATASACIRRSKYRVKAAARQKVPPCAPSVCRYNQKHMVRHVSVSTTSNKERL